MRSSWIVGVLLAGVLLGACGDPASEPEKAPPTPSAPGGTTRQQAPATPTTPMKAPTVLYLGDSLAMENQKVLGQELRKDLDAEYTSAPYSGTTLCDYLEGTGKRSLVPDAHKAAALVRSLHPDYVVLQFWGNAWGYTWCMDGITHAKAPSTYFARYAADAERLTEQIAAAGGSGRPRIVWVLQGPDPITPDRVRRVNAIYEERAATSGDVVADAGRTVSPDGARYTWAKYLPCTPYEREHPDYCTQPGGDRTELHFGDDYLHFCLAPTTSTPKPCPVRSPGILRIAREITRVIGERARSR
ncbi:SGNH/GDSL hydrolase family protein [Streptomyces sp. DG2A-72]|uniref:SGNH/GDSL hydrolase family protein n=1 Tax=Streptomyces sp. DG2A-72 TaxID=3051386 RepID=UPI00265C4886|nr:SGNH/GDSL hydrolase family protein [Streptomyces sp. DG2A-72]MDO0930671.1 SGNH/GDSL hydrolase family protein [Streptomyces sp. DG2A-72]